MKHTLLLLAVLLLLLIPAIPSAEIPVTAANITGTSIKWTWTTGYDLTHIYIDGIEVCGYETTSSFYIQSGLGGNTLHTINITDGTDYGNASATTLNVTAAGGGGFTDTSMMLIYGIIGGIIGAILIYQKYKKS